MTGDLRKTIRYEIRGRILEYGSGNVAVNYAKYLEGNMNRPNITKSIVQSQQDIETRVNQFFVDSIKIV